MNESPVLQGLIAKRAELEAEVRQLRLRIEALNAHRAAVQAAILVFDPQADVPPPRRTTKRTGLARAILAAIRIAGEPITSRQIADRIAVDMGVNMTNRGAVDEFRRRVGTALRSMPKHAVTKHMRDGRAWWGVQ